MPEQKEVVCERKHQEELIRKQASIDEVRELYATGHSIDEITRITGHISQTVKKYLDKNCPLCNGHYDNRLTGK